MTPSLVAPPPWNLTGNGLILVAHFPESFVRQQGFLADYQRPAYRGWLGAVMLVDYHTSGVGPYRELLFIPGFFRLGWKWGFSISKIYVSTRESVWNGVENWGIPKEEADFSLIPQRDGWTWYRVSRDGANFLELRARPRGPRFPITTRLLPGFKVIQQRRNKLLMTSPEAEGKARLVSLRDIHINPARFPDWSGIQPRLVLAVEDFRMTFPLPVELSGP